MPNGARTPYRYRYPDIEDSDDQGQLSPGVCHTSDSEETWDNKEHFFQCQAIAHTVLLKWKYLVWRNKRRTHIALPNNVYVAFRSAFDEGTALCIAALSARGVRPIPFICTRWEYRRWGYRERLQRRWRFPPLRRLATRHYYEGRA
jgi:hypothetical protein